MHDLPFPIFGGHDHRCPQTDGGDGIPSAERGLGPLHSHEVDKLRSYVLREGLSLNHFSKYARPGEVLVTQEVVDASTGVDVSFTEIGPVELKGISGVRLHAAHRPEAH
jgi:hypothetical protein